MTHARSTRRQPHSPHRYGPNYNGSQEFVCLRCGFYVTFAPEIAGVQNRNHCPYCLWSRHLDWREAGDRLSNCQTGMQPLGLTTKRSRNKYARERDGELMLVHRCTGCNQLVINRIAADDSTEAILELFAQSCAEAGELAGELAASDVSLLGRADSALVRRRLLGEYV